MWLTVSLFFLALLVNVFCNLFIFSRMFLDVSYVVVFLFTFLFCSSFLVMVVPLFIVFSYANFSLTMFHCERTFLPYVSLACVISLIFFKSSWSQNLIIKSYLLFNNIHNSQMCTLFVLTSSSNKVLISSFTTVESLYSQS